MTLIPPTTPNLKPSAEIQITEPSERWLRQKFQEHKARALPGAWVAATFEQYCARQNDADIVLLGGSAGSLKTSTMLVDAMAERRYPRMRAYFFRRTYKELEGGDGAIDQSRQLFGGTGATYNESSHTWTWPTGAQFFFRHCQHEKDVHPYQSQAMSWLGIDESTHWTEKMIRYLITRVRSTSGRLNVRIRLGTNPGGAGHKFHKNLFFKGICPHCHPELAPPPRIKRYDGQWSDGVKIDASIAYILSSIRDHNLLGARYIAMLKMQSPSTAKALLEGCWDISEGQYFDCFRKSMIISRRELKEEWWWPRWVAADYGFSISIGAAHLFLHEPQSPEFPRGRTIVADELGCQETAKDFAHKILEKWGLDERGKQLEYRWMPWYLSPDSFNESGQPFSLGAQMNDVLSQHQLRFNKANNDRAGGAMKIYTGLESGELVICAECRETIDALETRIHDPEKENDVLKIAGDPQDDYYDSMRYGYLSWETARQVSAPASVRAQERLKELWDKSPAAAMMQAQKIMAEEQEEGSPTVYGGTARARMRDLPKRRR